MRVPVAAVGAALLLTPVAACAQPAGGPPREDGGCARHQAEFAPLIGRSEAEARAALERMPGIRTVRAGGPGTPMTRDFRPDRATILLTAAGGAVGRILCG